MSTRIALTHTIERRYDRRVLLPTHWLRLRPAPHTQAAVTAFSLKIDTEPHFLNWVRDPFENHLARLDLPEPVFALKMTVDLVADLEPANPFDFLTEPYAANFPFEYPEQLLKELTPYLYIPKAGPRLADYLGALDPEPAYIVEKLGKLTGEVHRSLGIAGNTPPGAVDLEAVLQRGTGSPWEAAWLMTLSLRKLGLAARFAAGYRVLLASEAVPVHAWSEDIQDSETPLWLDSAGLHAWCEVFLPGAGWIGLDPSAGLFTHEGYIPLTASPDPLRALPFVAEAAEPGKPAEVPAPAEAREQIGVRRLIPAPEPAPYTEAEWADIRAVGKHVDDRLAADGISLAMGPSLCLTAPYADSPEWSTVAVGPRKRAAAEDLLARLRLRLAPGGVLHEAQGEWFGGEALPRWKLSCFFRTDGQPIWRNPTLLGGALRNGGSNGNGAGRPARPQGPGARLPRAPEHTGPDAPEATDAGYFTEVLAKKLGLSPEFVLPAHEDQLYELWQNRAHIQFEPPAEALRNPVQRRALAVKLSQTRLEPAGYVLPLRWDGVAERWTSGTWIFRRGALYLVPGDSPLGYRLPLESLPAGDDATESPDPERCPFEERPLLPEVYGEPSARLTRYVRGSAPPESADQDPPRTRAPRTALCVEVRHGLLRVFLPPLTHLEHWLDLVGTIEATAFSVGMPVMLEGYEPPEDFRLRRLTLEPEAGVLRIALPQADSWDELQACLGAAYTEGSHAGLTAERIAEDGTHQPPGGQAEIVLGGSSPPLSPFLLRPQLLHSLIAYWQQHPALSYFFAGRLVGPSGPAPRPDEGRDDALYELDIALLRMPGDDETRPWVPDRALRHLLADPAGDIRKAEIRIDQLYAPDRSSQRLGRIAIRSFETASDAKLAAAQALLLRALIAHLARRPADPRLTDFGPDLHDRYMLPAQLWEDLLEVLRDMERDGLPLQAEWFEPFLAQRFPRLGRIAIGDVGLELRTAHEPWPVLSEEVTAGGVTRFIDSANQRVQVELTGLTPTGHVLVCNGQRVPLQPTRTRGRYLAGVRYKAWNPPSSLHPTVPPAHSLVFDLLDARTGEVLGGCTWFPARPGLAGAAAAPLPAPEAEPGSGPHTHRPQPAVLPPWSPGGRFLAFGSGARRLAVPEAESHPRFRYLLDLTRVE
jgi:uncharacterized protein (DUF2126 family)/transglutaminase-like putative cysteine protease